MIAEELVKQEIEAWNSSVDMTRAFGQIPLHELTKKHCNFQIVGRKSTETYRLTTGYYGLTVKPTELQKKMDLTLGNIKLVFVIIDDILKVIKGLKRKLAKEVREVMKVLGVAILQSKTGNCTIAQESIE